MMYVTQGVIACLVCCFGGLVAEDSEKSGHDPHQSPLEIKSADRFLPYNPTVVQVGCGSLWHIKEVVELREQGVVYCFGKDKETTALLRREAQGMGNVYVVDVSGVVATHQQGAAFVKWWTEHKLSKIDLLAIDLSGKEKAFLETAAHIVAEAIVVFVATRSTTLNEIKQWMTSYEFILLSHWQDKQTGEGRGCFVKTPYYKGVYERKCL